MSDVWTRSSAEIIAFPDPAERPQRAQRADEPRGEILLFTGVRYERRSPGRGAARPIASTDPSNRYRS